MAICADPTGAFFGLWQADQHIGSAVENEHGAIAWFEVNTWDSAAAREFYGQLFNLTPEKMEGMEYHTMKQSDDSVCGVLQMTEEWGDLPPHWMSYFAVDNTDVACEQAAAAGGEVRVPAFDTPFGRIAVLSDPFGATFSVVQPSAA